jgi:hypothetical protein
MAAPHCVRCSASEAAKEDTASSAHTGADSSDSAGNGKAAPAAAAAAAAAVADRAEPLPLLPCRCWRADPCAGAHVSPQPVERTGCAAKGRQTAALTVLGLPAACRPVAVHRVNATAMGGMFHASRRLRGEPGTGAEPGRSGLVSLIHLLLHAAINAPWRPATVYGMRLLPAWKC